MKILVSGFKPFLGESVNPSEILANELSGLFKNVESVILPVEFERSFQILEKSVDQIRPDYLIMTGQAAGRKNVCFEKIGLNWIQSQNQDEVGTLPRAGRILPHVDLALMTSFPIEKIFFELKKELLPVEISFSAGTFVCNELYFRVLNKFQFLKSVFVHLPLLPEQLKGNDSRPTLEKTQQLRILQKCIETF